MKRILNKNHLAAGLTGIAASFAPCAHAAEVTSIQGNNLLFDQAHASQTLNARGDSWYNLTMGYKGWTHHSAWMYMTLKKGRMYKITATTDVGGLHPALSCWRRPQGKNLVDTSYAYNHFYNQWQDIIDFNAVDETSKAPLGKMKMFFAVNGYDRDGLPAQLTEEYQQSNVMGILDGEPGKLEISFVATRNSVYQCAVGGFHPEPPVDGSTDKYPIQVSVSGL